MGIAANWKKTGYYLKRNGIRATVLAVRERLQQKGSREASYRYEEVPQAELERQRTEQFAYAPLISILVPLYRTPKVYLEELVRSVQNQTYSHWELVLADATGDDSVKKALEQILEATGYAGESKAENDQEQGNDQEPAQGKTFRGQICYHPLAENGGISENTNAALQLATGAYVGLLDHDDVLTPDALYWMVKHINEGTLGGKAPLLLYSDEDKCNGDGSITFEPHYKMDFNLDLLLSNNYICHFLVMERELFCEVGFRKAFDGAQDFDLVLRAAQKILPETERICHIPKVLYHWRCHTGSTAENPQSKQYAYEAGLRAVQDFADRLGWQAKAEHLKHLGFYRLSYEPDLLTVREDVAAVGGSLFRKGKLLAGGYDEEGKVLHQGLEKGFSGYMHRGVLLQDVAAADIRCLTVKEAYRPLFEQVVGLPYTTVWAEGCKEEIFDWHQLPAGTDYEALSLQLGEAFRKEGKRICWDPGRMCSLK